MLAATLPGPTLDRIVPDPVVHGGDGGRRPFVRVAERPPPPGQAAGPGQEELEQHPGRERVALDGSPHERQQHAVGSGGVGRSARGARGPPASPRRRRRGTPRAGVRAAPRSSRSRRHSSFNSSNTFPTEHLQHVVRLGARTVRDGCPPGCPPPWSAGSSAAARTAGDAARGTGAARVCGAPPYDEAPRPGARDDRDEDTQADDEHVLTALMALAAGAVAAVAIRSTAARSGRPWPVVGRRTVAAVAAGAVVASGAPVPVGSALAGAGLAAAAVVDAVEGRIPTPVAYATAVTAASVDRRHARCPATSARPCEPRALTGVFVLGCAALWLAGAMGFGDVRLAAGTATAMLGGAPALVLVVWASCGRRGQPGAVRPQQMGRSPGSRRGGRPPGRAVRAGVRARLVARGRRDLSAAGPCAAAELVPRRRPLGSASLRGSACR